MNEQNQITEEQLNEIVSDFIGWGKGSWGQNHKDLSTHRFSQENIVLIYKRIAEEANRWAEYYENQI